MSNEDPMVESAIPKSPDYRTNVFKAKFEPLRDDIRPELKQFIGKILTFHYGFNMGDGDPFPGDIAYMCTDKCFLGYWAPERDLVRLTADELDEDDSSCATYLDAYLTEIVLSRSELEAILSQCKEVTTQLRATQSKVNVPECFLNGYGYAATIDDKEKCASVHGWTVIPSSKYINIHYTTYQNGSEKLYINGAKVSLF